jgi:hypothetical protein
MRRYYRVFVSSPYEELVEERRAVICALLQSGYIPIAMEHFAPGPLSVIEELKLRIKNCDMVVAIIGFEAGSLAPSSRQPYSEIEFDYAKDEFKIPVISCLKEEAGRSSGSTEGAKAIKRLRKKALKSSISSYWRDTPQLIAAVLAGIQKTIADSELCGLISAGGFLQPFAKMLPDCHLDKPLFDEWAITITRQAAHKLNQLTQQNIKEYGQVTYYTEVEEWIEWVVDKTPGRALEIQAICTQKEWKSRKVGNYFETYYKLAEDPRVTVQRVFVETSSWPPQDQIRDCNGNPTVWRHVYEHTRHKNVEPEILRTQMLETLPEYMRNYGNISGFVLVKDKEQPDYKDQKRFYAAMLHYDEENKISMLTLDYSPRMRELFLFIEDIFDELWNAAQKPEVPAQFQEGRL